MRLSKSIFVFRSHQKNNNLIASKATNSKNFACETNQVQSSDEPLFFISFESVCVFFSSGFEFESYFQMQNNKMRQMKTNDDDAECRFQFLTKFIGLFPLFTVSWDVAIVCAKRKSKINNHFEWKCKNMFRQTMALLFFCQLKYKRMESISVFEKNWLSTRRHN